MSNQIFPVVGISNVTIIGPLPVPTQDRSDAVAGTVTPATTLVVGGVYNDGTYNTTVVTFVTDAFGNQGVTVVNTPVVAIAGGTFDVTIVNTPTVQVQQVPGTANGLITNIQQALLSTAQIKVSAGQLYGYRAYNPNTAVAYLLYYNSTTAPGTPGSTVNLIDEVGIPAGTLAQIEGPNGTAYSVGIYAAVSASPSGSSTPGVGLIVTTLYK
jgi:hypothetical protein